MTRRRHGTPPPFITPEGSWARYPPPAHHPGSRKEPQALSGERQDGILHAIEAQDLDLEGTELVVLSACETARGQIDYGEGVSGLVRALRTAGARQVLVTLRPVGDRGAADYMARFYHHWLSQPGRSDPAAALRAAQLEAIEAASKGPGADPTWAQFVLIGG